MSQTETQQERELDPGVFPAGGQSSLWHHADFLNLWIAETISQFGTQISLVALPLLAVLTLDASAAQMGLLTAAGTLPFLLIGLFVGVWVDRLRRRPLMIAADILRGTVLLWIPLAWAFDLLTIHQLYVVALLTGTMTVLFDAAWQAFLPSVVSKRRLVDANSKLHVSASVAQVVGPGAGGLLVGLITAPMAILLDALSFFWSAVFLRRMKSFERRREPSAAGQSVWRDIREGLGTVFGNAILRPLALSGVTVTFFAGAFFAVYILFLSEDLGLGATAVGAVLATGGVGSLAGAAIAAPLIRRLGEGPTVIVARFLFGVFALTIPLAVLFPSIALAMVIASETLCWMMVIVGIIAEISIRQTVTPDHLLGRMAATFQFTKHGATPFGALMGGLMGEFLGLPATLVIASTGFMVAFVFVALSALRSYRGEFEAAVLERVEIAPGTAD
jgi:MFS family permease